jgi:hypothetical protein
MQSLEEAEEKARSFGCVVTSPVGSHLVQIVPTRDSFSRNTQLTYRLDGWDVDRTKVLAVLAGAPVVPRETYAAMLEQRTLKIGGVTGG